MSPTILERGIDILLYGEKSARDKKVGPPVQRIINMQGYSLMLGLGVGLGFRVRIGAMVRISDHSN